MAAKGVPRRLWDYGLVYESEILSRISRAPYERSGIEQITGETPDISEWLDFSFYDLVWYHVASNDTSTDPRQLGRWLGVSHCIGSAQCYWVLTKSGKVISSTTIQHVTQEDSTHPDTHNRIQAFDMAVQECLSDTNFVSNDIEGASPYIQDYSLPIPSRRAGVVPSDTEYGDMIHEEAPEDDTHDNLDNYIHAQLMLDVGGEQLQGRVIHRATEPDGTKKGMAHRNPLFDTRAYLVEFKDGSVAEYTANIIAENIYSQVDQEGCSFSILQEITDHKVDPKVALNESNGFYLSANGNRVNKKTTQGWKFLVEWIL